MKVWEVIFGIPGLFPFCDGSGADVFGRAGDIRSYAEEGRRFAGLKDRLHHLIVPVRGFDEGLGGVMFLGIDFQIAQGFGPALRIDGQVAGEAELLTVHTAGHEGEQDRAGAYEGTNARTGLMGDFGEDLSRVGDTRASGFADESDRFSFCEFLPELGFYFGFGFMDRVPFILVDDHFSPDGLEEAAGAAFIFHEEDLAFFYGVEDIGGQDLQ